MGIVWYLTSLELLYAESETLLLTGFPNVTCTPSAFLLHFNIDSMVAPRREQPSYLLAVFSKLK